MPLYTAEDFTVEVGTAGGLVASVDVSGGSSGLVFSGGPITGSGTITLASGVLTAGYGGTGLTGFTAGPVMFGATTTALGQDNALWWDNGNKRLGLGTVSPSQQLHTTGKAIFGGSITGSGDVASPSIAWQFGDIASLTGNDQALGSAGYNISIAFGSRYALPVTGAAQIALGVAPTYTGAGALTSFVGTYSSVAHNSVNNNITTLMGSMSRAVVIGGGAGVTPATNAIGAQNVLWCFGAGVGSRAISNGIGNVASLVLAPLSSVTVTNYTAYRSDNTSSPGDGGFNIGYQDSSYATVTNATGFYYTPVMATNTNQYAFRSDPIADSTGYATQYQCYMPGTITWTPGAGGWYVNAGSGKNYFGGRVGIGTVRPESPLEVVSTLGPYVASPSTTYPNGITVTQYGGAAPATISLRATQGTQGSPIIANNGDCVGQITFAGYNNSTWGYPPTAIIAARMDQTTGAGGTSPTGLEMWTGTAIGTVNGAAYGLPMQGNPYYGLPWKRMTLDSSGVQTLYDQPYCLATQTAGQSINSGIITDLQFNLNSYYQGDPSRGGTLIHDTATNNTRFTAPRSGVYMMVARITFPANATGVRSIFISKSGLGIVAQTTNTAPSGAITCVLEATALVSMTAGQYLTVSGYQTSGGALTNTSGIGITDASIVKVA